MLAYVIDCIESDQWIPGPLLLAYMFGYKSRQATEQILDRWLNERQKVGLKRLQIPAVAVWVRSLIKAGRYVPSNLEMALATGLDQSTIGSHLRHYLEGSEMEIVKGFRNDRNREFCSQRRGTETRLRQIILEAIADEKTLPTVQQFAKQEQCEPVDVYRTVSRLREPAKSAARLRFDRTRRPRKQFTRA